MVLNVHADRTAAKSKAGILLHYLDGITSVRKFIKASVSKLTAPFFWFKTMTTT